ncbi:MAG: LamG domain-containing protein [bacterium]|nr:LamG domain-containing protein [bacterium]
MTNARIAAVATVMAMALWSSPSLFAQSCTPAPPGLVSWWSGDGSADDLVGGNDGALAFGAGYAPGFVTSGNGLAFDLDGVDDRVEILTSFGLSPAETVSVSAWIRVAQPTTQFMCVYDRFETHDGFGLGVKPAGTACFGVNGQAGSIAGTTSVVDGSWRHLTGTYDRNASELKVYVDGVLEGTAAYGAPIDYNPQPRNNIGWCRNTPGTTFPFLGLVDEVLVFDRALDDAEVAAMFLAGAAGVCKPCQAPFCAGQPNSSGSAATLCPGGSTQVNLNAFELQASNLPQGQFGYFLASQSQGVSMPPGSQGIICVAGNIGRFNTPSQIIQGPTGTIQVDLTSIPVNPPSAVQPGDTWNFQCWYRDNNPGPTSNFTDAVSLTFF